MTGGKRLKAVVSILREERTAGTDQENMGKERRVTALVRRKEGKLVKEGHTDSRQRRAVFSEAKWERAGASRENANKEGEERR